MSLIRVNAQTCRRDGICLEVCPCGVISTDAEGYPVTTEASEQSCIDCGHCAAVCATGALTHGRLPAEAFLPNPQPRPETAGEVESLLRGRRSVREFKDKPVDHELLARLLDVARRAPTAINSQKIGWIMVEDPAKTRRLAELGMEWLRGAGVFPRYAELWDAGREVVLRGAPHVAVAYAPADYPWGLVDGSIALTYLELAAAAHGLGACWAGLLTRAASAHPPVAEALGLSDERKICGALMLGWPKHRYRLVPPRQPARVEWL